MIGSGSTWPSSNLDCSTGSPTVRCSNPNCPHQSTYTTTTNEPLFDNSWFHGDGINRPKVTLGYQIEKARRKLANLEKRHRQKQLVKAQKKHARKKHRK